MAQNKSREFFFWGIFLIVAVFVMMAMLKKKCDYCKSSSESYSPYKGMGSYIPKTGYNYLDVYEQEDYYKKHPFIYPTPLSYTTSWYKGRNKFDHQLYNLENNIAIQ